MNTLLYCVCFLLFGASCSPPAEDENAQGRWIQGTEQEKFQAIERHFRGFDNAMVEVGYRYQELYRAGSVENWGYAAYQIEKMRVAIENGLERRPARAASAQHFLAVSLPQMKQSLESKSISSFEEAFENLTQSCNSCHVREQVSFINVSTPSLRQPLIIK